MLLLSRQVVDCCGIGISPIRSFLYPPGQQVILALWIGVATAITVCGMWTQLKDVMLLYLRGSC
jgi:hypothetical protein